MRLERLTSDKIKIFLTFDDLRERGISKDEIWMDIPKVHDLFRDMISEASDELGFDAEGPVIVEVFSLPSQGLVVIVTITEDDEDTFDDSFIELQITMDVNESFIFKFDSIEAVIQLAKECDRLRIENGTLYYHDDSYYLKLQETDAAPLKMENFIPLIVEFGESATITTYKLEEYGKTIIPYKALKMLNVYFN
ncbi:MULTISPECIES: genetic competence negative regulator [Bacillaceae]|uniref:Adapter protein MecA n=1 Tax=Evansella alkalicola TaxID=745819 RepID=A0ABS6JZG1_9BACI|nr:MULTISPECIES: genetic competence negative regulator [Bacillaceae]MBU9723980.1 genetic competence negative regulator [Bacillus alkalicola]